MSHKRTRESPLHHPTHESPFHPVTCHVSRWDINVSSCDMVSAWREWPFDPGMVWRRFSGSFMGHLCPIMSCGERWEKDLAPRSRGQVLPRRRPGGVNVRRRSEAGERGCATPRARRCCRAAMPPRSPTGSPAEPRAGGWAGGRCRGETESPRVCSRASAPTGSRSRCPPRSGCGLRRRRGRGRPRPRRR